MKKSLTSVFLMLFILVLTAGCLLLASSADNEYVDMTTLKPTRSTVGWGSLAVNKGLDGGSIDMTNAAGGVTVYDKGFTAHADSSIEFDISGIGATMFHAFAGADHSTNNQTPASTSIKFLVYADAKVIYESQILGYYDPAEEVYVAIPQGTKTLKLVSDCVGSNTGDHSAWGSPRLYTDAGILEKLNSITVTTDKNVYLTGEQVQVRAECKNLGGAVCTPETLTYAVSDESIATIGKTGLLTPKKAGLVKVTVTAKSGEIECSKTVAVTFMETAEVRNFDIASPSGNIRVRATVDEQGMVSYTVKDGEGLSVLEPSYIGINTELCDFSNALVYVKQVPVTEFDETYTMISGKKSSVRNHYNETVLTFEKDVYYFDVYFRVYDDGYAYRFVIRNKNGSEETLKVIEETGTYTLPSKSFVYSEIIDVLTSSFCYESGYSGKVIEEIKSSRYSCYPALISVNKDGKKSGKYLLLSESDLFGGDIYAGTVLKGTGTNTFGTAFAPKVTNGTALEITTDFTSPWRYGIFGDLSDIVESCMSENLAEAAEGDYSWVVPGVTAWMWLSEGYNGQRTEATIRDYVDLAAEMGWKYLILDEGWQPNSTKPGKVYDGYFRYFDDLVKYAADKGVGFIAWVKYCDLDTPEEREVLTEWANKGIKGIKADFFDSEDQKTLEGFKAIYEKAAENHLIVNCHGAGKPTGERRTYPNVINREAVNGEEYGGFWVNQVAYWAYARNVVGPIDITPRLYPSASGNTIGVQMACNIIFESGIPCMASDSEEYRKFNAASFYKNLPSAWDDIKYLDGAVGDWVSLARRSGEIWYAASISNSAKKNLKMDLGFLDEGEYYAMIYKDKSKNEVVTETKIVTNKDTLEYSLLSQGGYIVKFVKAVPGVYSPKEIKAASDLSIIAGSRKTLEYTLVGQNIQISDVLFESSDPAVVAVDGKGTLTAVTKGKATVTITSVADRSVKTAVNVTVKECPVELNPEFTLKNASSDKTLLPGFDFNDSSKIQLVTVKGEAGKDAVTNELTYTLPNGDFTVTLELASAPSVAGASCGVVLHIGENYYIIERNNEGGNKITYRSSDKEASSANDTRVGASFKSLNVTIEKKGDQVSLKCGYNKTGQRNYQTVTVSEEDTLELGLFATAGTSSESEGLNFASFAVNGEKVNFAVEREIQDDPTTEVTETADPSVKTEETETSGTVVSTEESTVAETTKETETTTTEPSGEKDGGSNVGLIVGIIAGVAVVVGVALFFIIKKKKS